MVLFRVILPNMFCYCQPSCCCCLLLVVVCVGGCGCGGGGSFVRLFVCSFLMCLCVVGTVCCAVVSLRRVVPYCVVVFVFGVFVVVVVCRCVSLSVRVRREILGLGEKTNYRESICQ